MKCLIIHLNLKYMIFCYINFCLVFDLFSGKAWEINEVAVKKTGFDRLRRHRKRVSMGL